MSAEWMQPPNDGTCAHCGRPVGASYWSHQGRPVHLRCVDWGSLPEPPYVFRLPEIRARWRSLREQLQALEQAGRRLRAAQAEWPRNALQHAERIVALFQQLDLRWPHYDSPRERARRDWYEQEGPRDH